MSHSQEPVFIDVQTVEARIDNWAEIGGPVNYNLLVYRIGEEIYLGRSRARLFYPGAADFKVLLEGIYEKVWIPDAHIYPLFPQHFTRAPDPLPQDTHVVEPMLWAYKLNGEPTLLAEKIFDEAKINELLLTHPHPNIAKYLGCRVKNGRITGLCFEKLQTLGSSVNPGHAGKLMFDATKRPLKDLDKVLRSVKSGIEHLHSLGLAHNALNPHSIAFPAAHDDDTAVLIKLNMCAPFGHSLDNNWRPTEWYDEKNNISVASNDLDAIEELTQFLTNGKDYKFGADC